MQKFDLSPNIVKSFSANGATKSSKNKCFVNGKKNLCTYRRRVIYGSPDDPFGILLIIHRILARIDRFSLIMLFKYFLINIIVDIYNFLRSILIAL